MADALVSTILLQLSSTIQLEIEQEVRLVVGVTKNVENLSSTFRKVQAVLKDAEEKQVNNEPLKLWLEDLKGVAYDMDDLLDEWQTKILLRSQQEGVDDARISMKKKVCTTYLFSPCFCFRKIALGHNFGCRIKKIKQRLDEIATEKDRYHLIENSTSERRVEETIRSQTSSLVDVSEIFGRDWDKDFIISKLMSESSHQKMGPAVPIISIVGMGGLGKTTLAQLAFNDAQVIGHFQKRMWVCVSEPFDKAKIAKAIIKAIEGENVVDGDGTTWEDLHHQLSNSVDGKHFLLVLDDVWTEKHREWGSLKLSLNCGAKGSRIIVTTRNERVAKMMGATCTHSLGTLSNADCWSLLSHIAFAQRREEECAELKDIGMKIAVKCKGLPLSAKTIGSLLLYKTTKQEWLHVLGSDTWEISGVEETILPALLLSYYDMPSHLKRCFAYYAIFPKDWRIYKNVIIKMWMAQGFLGTGKNKELEMIGEEYFNNLAMRSIFQDFDLQGSEIKFFKMHDLVHDFAQFLTKNECLMMEINNINNYDDDQELNNGKARHLTLVFKNEGINTIPSSVYKAKNLRTLLVVGEISSVSSDLFHYLTCIRVLSLTGTKLKELPTEVEKLIHLRYLNLSFTSLKELPKTVINLYNLQTLDLYWCGRLCKLPEGIERLVNLRHLGINECHQLSYLPQGIGRLSSLRTLTDFIVGRDRMDGGGCKIGKLKKLNLLQGHLRIIGLGKVANGNEAEEANMKNKEQLRHLSLHFAKYTGVAFIDDLAKDDDDDDDDDDDGGGGGGGGGVNDDDNDHDDEEDNDGDGDGDDDRGHMLKTMEDVLESLQPHPNLQKLEIHDYFGTKFPNWMVRDDDSVLLSNVVYLDLYNWKKCKQLPLALGKLPSLEKLRIGGMDEVKYMGFEFFGIEGVSTAKSDGGVNTIFPKLKVLEISVMLNFKEWDLRVKEDGRKFVIMPCLHYLVIIGCPKLKGLPYHLLHATSLKKLFIWQCPKLTWAPPSSLSSSCCLPLPHLEELVLRWDAGVFSKSLSLNGGYTCFPHLRFLTIRKSPYQSLPEGLGKLTVLQSLHIQRSLSIMSMPKELQHLSMLQKLTIYKCHSLGARCQKGVGADWSKISHIPNIEIDGKKIQ